MRKTRSAAATYYLVCHSRYAMTGYKLLLGAFRNLNVCLGLLVKSPHKLSSPWRTFLCAASQYPRTAILPKHFCVSPIQHHVFLIPWSKSVTGISVRHKSNKSSHKKVKRTVEEDLEEEDTDEEITDSEDEFEDDPSIVKNYKDLEKVVQSFRFDVKVGDTLDLILGEDKETETAVVMRVVLKKASEKNENDKYKVMLRRWKNLKVPKQDVLK
ncbi:hypothetical protein L345_06171, partial [Ophiophagus hannah]